MQHWKCDIATVLSVFHDHQSTSTSLKEVRNCDRGVEHTGISSLGLFFPHVMLIFITLSCVFLPWGRGPEDLHIRQKDGQWRKEEKEVRGWPQPQICPLHQKWGKQETNPKISSTLKGLVNQAELHSNDPTEKMTKRYFQNYLSILMAFWEKKAILHLILLSFGYSNLVELEEKKPKHNSKHSINWHFLSENELFSTFKSLFGTRYCGRSSLRWDKTDPRATDVAQFAFH